MATLKFLKVASKVKLRCVSPNPENPENVSSLKEEVKFLKNILHMKRFGGGFSELAYKVKALERKTPNSKKEFYLKIESVIFCNRI